MTNHCPRCDGEIRLTGAGMSGMCLTCGQRFFYGLPTRPILTKEDWTILQTHDASEATDQA